MRYSATPEQIRALEKAKNELVLDLPFYSTVALMVPIMFDPSVSTACTDGASILFNPEWTMDMRHRQRVGLMCHEVEHIVRLHPWRRKGRDPEIWNEACDAVINRSIRDQGMELPDGGVEYDWVTANSSEEWVYDELIRRGRKPKQKPQAGEGQSGDEQVGLGEPAWGRDDLKDGSKDGQSELKAKELGKSAVTIAKALGKLPAHLKELIDGINEPSVDWREPMSAWMSELAQLDSTWSRPNRTWLTRGVRLPGLQSEDALGELGIVLDQSGSMSTPEIRQSFAEVCGMVALTNPRRVIVVYVDSEVAHVDVFDNPSEAEIKSKASRRAAGGTDMRVGLDYLEKKYPNIAGAVVLGDGDSPCGDPRPFPVLWAITSERGQDAPWGTTVRVKVNP